jgi:cell division septation protein DedD
MRWIFFTLIAGNLLLLVVMWQSPSTVSQHATAEAVDVTSGGQRITLLKEANVVLPKRGEAAAGRRHQRCLVLGPYAEAVDARHALARSQTLGLRARVKQTELATGEPTEYWVHVPPRRSRQEARRVLRDLQRRSIDSFIITSDELTNGISLGLFRNRESAEGLVKRVRGFGIQVQIKVVDKMQTEFWFEIPVSPEFGERLRERVMADDRNVSWRMIECEQANR